MSSGLVLQLPDENTKGILLFVRRVALFNQVVNNPTAHTVEEVDEAYEFLYSLVVEPKDKKKAKALVMQLSSKQLQGLFEDVDKITEPDPKE